MLKSDFGLDSEASLKVRGQVASYLLAWQTARTRIKLQAEAEASSELREWAKPIPQTDYVAMRQGFAKLHGELEDKQIPSKEYLKKKLHELENGEFRAEALPEVVSRDEVDPDTLTPVWDAKGHIAVKRGNTVVLRMRLTAVANALIMMKLKHTARRELKEFTPALLEKYKDYLLGDYAYGLRASDDSGEMITPVDAGAKLQARYSEALLQAHVAAGDALQASTREVVERAHSQGAPVYYTLGPLRKRGCSARSSATPPAATDKGGKGKDKGKGKGRKGHTRTPDNKPICFRYNSKAGCKKKAKCHFAHVCTRCFGDQPAINCPQKGRRIHRERLTDSYPASQHHSYRRENLQWMLQGQLSQCYTCFPVGRDNGI